MNKKKDRYRNSGKIHSQVDFILFLLVVIAVKLEKPY
jgi:hypothetical protein